MKKKFTTIYYLDDPVSKTGTTPVTERAMLEAVLAIAKKQGLLITDEMILYEVSRKKKNPANVL